MTQARKNWNSFATVGMRDSWESCCGIAGFLRGQQETAFCVLALHWREGLLGPLGHPSLPRTRSCWLIAMPSTWWAWPLPLPTHRASRVLSERRAAPPVLDAPRMWLPPPVARYASFVHIHCVCMWLRFLQGCTVPLRRCSRSGAFLSAVPQPYNVDDFWALL